MKNDIGKQHQNAAVLEVLKQVADLLAGPEKRGSALARVEESHSFTASGIGCQAWDETAAKWSIIGALAKFTMPLVPWNVSPMPGLRNEALFDAAFNYLLAAAILQAPQTVNGVNNRGFHAVQDLIELATLLAEHEAAVLPALIIPPHVHGGAPSPELRKHLERIMQARNLVQVPS